MRYHSEYELELMYSVIEKAVKSKSAVDFPKDIYAELSLVVSKNGFAFIIPGLYWEDGNNRYEAVMKMDDKDLNTLNLYVKGYRRGDGKIGDEVWMFKDTYRRRTSSTILTFH